MDGGVTQLTHIVVLFWMASWRAVPGGEDPHSREGDVCGAFALLSSTTAVLLLTAGQP